MTTFNLPTFSTFREAEAPCVIEEKVGECHRFTLMGLDENRCGYCVDIMEHQDRGVVVRAMLNAHPEIAA